MMESVHEHRPFFRTLAAGFPTTGSEVAPRRRIERAGNFSLEFGNLLETLRTTGICWDRRKKRLGIRVDGITIDLVTVSDFDNLSQIHHRNPIRYLPHN